MRKFSCRLFSLYLVVNGSLGALLHQASQSTLRPLCDDTSDSVLIEIKGDAWKWVAIHFGATSLFSMGTGSLASLQSYRIVNSDACCEWIFRVCSHWEMIATTTNFRPNQRESWKFIFKRYCIHFDFRSVWNEFFIFCGRGWTKASFWGNWVPEVKITTTTLPSQTQIKNSAAVCYSKQCPCSFQRYASSNILRTLKKNRFVTLSRYGDIIQIWWRHSKFKGLMLERFYVDIITVHRSQEKTQAKNRR